VRGVVHEVSATGTTVYVEPADLMDANNELRSAHDEYRQEVHRILTKLTGQARAVQGELRQVADGVSYLDAALGRAEFAEKLTCVRPARAGQVVHLSQARHPLLGTEAVPIDIVYPEHVTSLVITGPNTGGKTVALKTLGLLAMLNQSGIPVPADEGSKLPIFDAIYADIGDEQSIAQSLSTFSGHMRTIAEYVSAAGPRSLVLLDELGAGTDPEEGSALAMAILDHLREVGAISFVTTHHSALKAYAYSHDDVSNASVEFDTETLRPAFRLLTGVPGSSHALTIAERTGIPHAVVERAHRYMNEQQSDSAQLIRRLTEQEHAVRSEQQRLAEEREEAQRRSREAEARQRSLDERERTLREEGIGRLERFTADARRRLENLIRELREREITRADTKRAKQFVQELEQAAEQEEASLQAEQEQRGSADSAEGGVGEAPATEGEHGPPPEERDHPAQLNPGAAVKLRGPGTRGVLRRRAKGNRWVVQTDTVTVTVPESELIALARRDQPEQKPQYAVSMSSPNQHVPQELDVRGMRMAEADDAVRRYIDEALLANRDTIGIIHGKGEGVLQSGVRDILGQHPSVERYEYAVPENGGFGKTVAYLKREHA
jgi:DNA mismatch repair protein MutS2